MITDESEIIKFFKNQTIFLTGGTGFLGKLLIEKLLRVCWDINRIYILVRPKRNMTPQQRFEEIFGLPCFDLIKNKNVKEKVFLISGDCDKPRLGLNCEDIEILKRETTCVIHAAANVKFTQTMIEASQCVIATKEMLELAKKMPNLKAFVHVSTAFSNCTHPHIKEKFYEPPMKAETLIDLVKAVDEESLQNITPSLLGKWPNPYVYLKCISEDVVKRASTIIPIVVVRPAVVGNTFEEPIKGWIDNIYGFISVGLGMYLGVVRSLYGINENNLHMVPADHVCNCILAAIWKRARDKDESVQIYNCVGQPLTIRQLDKLLQTFYWDFASEKFLYYKSFKIRPNKYVNDAWNFGYKTLVYIMHFLLLCLGKPTNAIEKYKAINKVMLSTSYFTTNQWKFDENNVIKLKNEMCEEDKKIFKFGENIDWYNYIRTCCLGIRLYLMKDPIDTIPKGRKKLRKLFIIHYTLVFIFTYLVYVFFRSVISF